jgi:hypothetical protein
MRGNGERIGPQNLPTSSIAGGIWNLLNQQRAQQRGAWPSATPAVVTDPYFMYVPLLLNTTSTNGQQNNTFLDSSTNNFTITRNGTPTQGAFTPYQPSGYWSGYFSGTTDYLTVPNNAAFELSNGNFTIETWVQTTSSRQYDSIVSKQTSSATGNWWLLMNNASATAGDVAFWCYDYNSFLSAMVVTTGASIRDGAWHHIALVRNGSQWVIYIDGVSRGTQTSSITIGTLNAALYVGSNQQNSSNTFSGYMSNFRFVKGTAVYTSAFTPSTTPLTATQSANVNGNPSAAITGTQCSLLACSSNRFIDIGGQVTPNVITVNGTPKVQAFQPFSPAASYSAATYGGSGYFGGSDYLSNSTNNTALAMGSGDFTIEFWLNAPSDASPHIIYDSRLNTSTAAGGFQIYHQSGTVYAYGGAATNVLLCSGSITPNAWNHVAFVRNGSSTGNVKAYVNGVLTGTYGSADASNYSQGYLNIGCYLLAGSPANYYSGYLSNFRMVKGTAIYTTAFTPPTAPVTAVSGTSLLTNFTNAGIYDAAWQNNALTVGDAQASTTQYKWSPTSMRFDGTGDWLTMRNNPAFAFGTGDFTIELWAYFTSVANFPTLLDSRASSSSTAGFNLGLSSAKVQLYTTSQLLIGATTLSSNQWYYIAITRSGATLKIFVNGSQDATTTNSTNWSDQTLIIGATPDLVNPMTGYIQDLRITKGVARTITTPTAAFPTR